MLDTILATALAASLALQPVFAPAQHWQEQVAYQIEAIHDEIAPGIV